jgi:hypothetical protein
MGISISRAQTCSNASTRRSGGEPTSCASSPTQTPAAASTAHLPSNRRELARGPPLPQYERSQGAQENPTPPSRIDQPEMTAFAELDAHNRPEPIGTGRSPPCGGYQATLSPKHRVNLPISWSPALLSGFARARWVSLGFRSAVCRHPTRSSACRRESPNYRGVSIFDSSNATRRLPSAVMCPLKRSL